MREPCFACEGMPKAPNDPCGLCGRSSAPPEEILLEVTVVYALKDRSILEGDRHCLSSVDLGAWRQASLPVRAVLFSADCLLKGAETLGCRGEVEPLYYGGRVVYDSREEVIRKFDDLPDHPTQPFLATRRPS